MKLALARCTVVVAACAALLSHPSLSFAWSFLISMEDGFHPRWYVNAMWFKVQSTVAGSATSCTGSSSDHRSDVMCALAAWNGVAVSTVNMGADFNDSTPLGENHISQIARVAQVPGTSIAYTWVYWSHVWVVENGNVVLRRGIDEVDIAYETAPNGGSWFVGPVVGHNVPAGSTSLRQTLLHELGHGLNLGHEDGFPSVMNALMPGGWFGQMGASGIHVPTAHDRALLNQLYTGTDEETNVALLPYRWDTENAEYVRPYFLNAPRPQFCVGGSIPNVELSIQNLGTQAVTTKVGWYLSTNQTISTSDIRTAHFSVSLPRYGRLERRIESGTAASVPIWSGVPPGIYYLGAIVDYEGVIAEESEADNVIGYGSAPLEVISCP